MDKQGEKSFCLICSKPSTGVYFQVDSCRACASFLKRSIKANKKYRCINGDMGQCDVTIGSGYSCKQCRYMKALRVGMTLKDGNGHHSHENLAQIEESDNEAGVFSNNFIIPQTIGQQQEKTNSLKNFDMIGFFEPAIAEIKRLFSVEPQCSSNMPTFTLARLKRTANSLKTFFRALEIEPKEKIKVNQKVDFMKVLEFRKKYLLLIAKLLMEIPEFEALPYQEKLYLFRKFWPLYIILASVQASLNVFGYDDSNLYLVYEKETAITYGESAAECISYLTGFSAGSTLKLEKDLDFNIKYIFKPFKELGIDAMEFSYMTLQLLWSHKCKDDLSQSTNNVSSLILQIISTEIHNYYLYEKGNANYSFRISEILKIIGNAMELSLSLGDSYLVIKIFDNFKSIQNDSEISSLV